MNGARTLCDTHSFRKRRLSLTSSSHHKTRRFEEPQAESVTAGEITDGVPDTPFSSNVVGIYSCHGMEPLYDEEEGDDDDDYEAVPEVVIAKINQDRGGMVYPYGGPKSALFAVYDGHGEGGEKVSQYVLSEVQKRLIKHALFKSNVPVAFRDVFHDIDDDLKQSCDIESFFAGTTACVCLVADDQIFVANTGDSRAVLGIKKDGKLVAKDLSVDQNPDREPEKSRITNKGGYISDPPSEGLSARVWLDKDHTQIGLAMARSIGDHAVSEIGVIATPEVSVSSLGDFLVLASDGVWEFLSSQQVVDIVHRHSNNATEACKVLIETAAERWQQEEEGYRDDISAIVVNLASIFSS